MRIKTGARRAVESALLWSALVVGGAAAFWLRQPWTRSGTGMWMWASLVVASALAAWALRRIDSWAPEPDADTAPPISTPLSYRLAAFACFAVSVLLVAWVVARLWPNYFVWHGTVLAWGAAIALAIAGGFLLGSCVPRGEVVAPGSPTPATQPADALEIPVWLEVVCVAAIAALAVFVRVYKIGTIPVGIYGDETNGALDALNILEGRGDTPFGVGWYQSPAAFAYYMAGLFKLFGANWGALKAVSLIPAILTVLALYPLGRLMFGQIGGLSAMAFLAVNRWHMSMSRWGWAEVAPPLFQILATFFLLRGLRDRRASDFALGGVISGLMMYTYLASRLALATLGVFALYYLIVSPGGPLAVWRRHWRGFVLFLVGWIVAVAPIAVTHIRDPFTFSNRVGQISIFRDIRDAHSYQPLWLNVEDHLRFFHQIGDHQGKHNLPNEPHTDPLVGLLFLVGLCYAVLRPRDHRRGLLWMWLLFGMAGGVFSSHHESPQSYRTLTAVPAVALLAGDALARIARGARALASRRGIESAGLRSRPVGVAAVAGLVVGAWGFSAVWETNVYFGRQADDVSVQCGFNPGENGVARDVLAALDRRLEVYVSPRFASFSPLRFLVYGAEKRRAGRSALDAPPFHTLAVEEDLPVPATGGDALFIVDQYYLPMLDYVRQFYPGLRTEVAQAPDGSPMYLRIHLSADDLSRAQGLSARITGPGGATQVRVTRGVDATAADAGVTRVEWFGGLQLKTANRYDFEPATGLEMRVDGEPWRGERFLSRGLHAFAATLSSPLAGPDWQLRWHAPDAPWSPVPASAFVRIQPPQLGLTGFYYANGDWSGEPVFHRTTPMLLLTWGAGEPIPWAGVFSARYVGFLRVAKAGGYRFRIEADDGARLIVGGRTLGEELTPNQPNRIQASMGLQPGLVPIEVDYVQWGGGAELQFFWQPPGEPEAIVPPTVLVPLDSKDAPPGATSPPDPARGLVPPPMPRATKESPAS